MDTRDILTQICKVLAAATEFDAKGLKYESTIYIAPTITWFEGGAPLELQVVDSGDNTVDRDGSARRAQYSITVGILYRRPTQFKSKHASILSSIAEDLQTYTRAIRRELDGNFLPATDVIGDMPTDLLVRPLVYWRSTGVLTNGKYPDLLIKELLFTGGINDAL